LHILLKRKAQLLIFILATFCTVAIGIFAIIPTDKLKAHILVKVGREGRSVPTIRCGIPIINSNPEAQINSKIVILKDRFLIQDVVTFLNHTTIRPDLYAKKKAAI
jgi:hypothetical protein